MSSYKMAKGALSIAAMLFFTGCSETGAGKNGLLQKIIIEKDKVFYSAYKAIDDKPTLVLTAGGLFFTIDDFDEKVSNWATKHNPVFGSEKAADDWSDNAKSFLVGEAILSTGYVFFDDPDDPKRWREVVAVGGTAGLTYGSTDGMKSLFDRQRPDKSNDRSFPSGHSSTSLAAAEVANRNFCMSKKWPGYINYGIAASVAWGRVEAKKHYPKDVLIGAALGRFVTNFVYEYCELSSDDKTAFEIVPTDSGVMAQLTFHF